MNKTLHELNDGLAGLESGMTLLVGGFGLSGNPEKLIEAVHASGISNLTLVSGGTTERNRRFSNGQVEK